MTRSSALGLGIVLLYAFAFMSIGLTRDWELLHEDNGALHTTFALSHVRLGLGRTLAHDYFFEPRTGLEGRYGAHPPGTGLILAAAFALTGSDTPAVARLVAIGFQLGSIVLLVWLLRHLFDPAIALIGGALMATLPMGAFFGRMVNYEPLCLFAVLLELVGYARWSRGRSRHGPLLITLGIVLGGLIDWPALFFAIAIAGAMAAECLKRRPIRLWPVAVPLASAIGMVLLDLGHLWYVATGPVRSMRLVDKVLSGPMLGGWRLSDALGFVWSQLEIARRYYTDAGLVSAILIAGALLAFRSPAVARLFEASDTGLLRRLLAITGGAAAVYVLAAPGWARIHAYWQFYALPYVVLAMLLVGRALLRLGHERDGLLPRALLALFVIDTVVGSATTLYFRHSTKSSHTTRQVAELRVNAMVPAYLERAGAVSR